ncbi:MAG: O-antigen ligase family protein [Chthonomonadales bacterium]|nr:O-antigen ligase family protein [Chthonomonadales bacterium]
MRVGAKIATGAAFLLVAPIVLPATPATSWLPAWVSYFVEVGLYQRAHAAVLLLGALLVCACYCRPTWGDPDRRTVWLLMSVLLAAYGVPTLQPTTPVSIVEGNSAILLAIAAGLLASRIAGTVSRAAAVLITAASLQAVYAYLGLLSGEHVLVSGSLVRAGGTYDRPNALGMLLASALPLSTALMHMRRSAVATLACATCAMVLYCGLLLSGSRAAALGFLGGAVVAAAMAFPLLSDKSARKVALTIAVTSGVLVVTVNVLRNLDPIRRESTARSTRGHVSYWQAGMNAFTKHWSLGAGAGSAMVSIPVHANGVTEEVHVPVANNLLIEWLAEFGVAGGVLYVLFAKSIVAVLRAERGHVSAGLSGAWTAYAVTGWFVPSYGSSNRPGGVVLGMLVGMTILCIRGTGSRASSAGHRQ